MCATTRNIELKNRSDNCATFCLTALKQEDSGFMKPYKIFALLLLSLSALHGCGGSEDANTGTNIVEDEPVVDTDDSESEVDSINVPSEPAGSDGAIGVSGLVGTWKSGCIPPPGTPNAPGQFIITSTYDQGKTESTSAQYSFGDCADLNVEYLVRATYVDSAIVTTTSGVEALEYDSLVDSISVRYSNEEALSAFNSTGLCGIVLTIGVYSDLTECLINQGVYFRERYTLLLVDGDILYGADVTTGDGNTPETRPTNLDFNTPYNRIN